MRKTRQSLERLNLPSRDNHTLKPSPLRFPDGGQWRIEIPGCEGPRVFREVIDAAED